MTETVVSIHEPASEGPEAGDPAASVDSKAGSIARAIARVTAGSSAISMPKLEQQHFVAQARALRVKVPVASASWVELGREGRDDQPLLRVRLPSEGAEVAAALAPDGTVTYAGALSETDLAVQTLTDGVRLQTVIQGPGAPTEFVYAMDLPAGSRMVKDNGGGIAILDEQNAFVRGVAPPWAFDRMHQPVPTHYELVDDAIVQVVAHDAPGFAYPIVADPWLGEDLIDHATWQYVSNGWIMHVYPTGWAKVWGGYLPAAAGWDELYERYRGGLTTNLGSMRNQYICHHMLSTGGIFGGDTWDLEEWVPDVGLSRFMLNGCNP